MTRLIQAACAVAAWVSLSLPLSAAPAEPEGCPGLIASRDALFSRAALRQEEVGLTFVGHATFNVGAEDARVVAILGPSVGDMGVEQIDVSGEGPWNGLRANSSQEQQRSIKGLPRIKVTVFRGRHEFGLEVRLSRAWERTMKVDGRCHCDFITFEAEIVPEKVWLCHCTDCQTLSGSAFRTVAPTEEGAFTLLSGEVKNYVKIGTSGARRLHGFCPECGSPIYSTSESDGPKVYNLRVGTLSQRWELTPRTQIWCRSALPWTTEIKTQQCFEMGPDRRP